MGESASALIASSVAESSTKCFKPCPLHTFNCLSNDTMSHIVGKRCIFGGFMMLDWLLSVHDDTNSMCFKVSSSDTMEPMSALRMAKSGNTFV